MNSKPTFVWQGDVGVLDALLERKKNIEQGKPRNADGRTIGILFDNGGQRGVFMGGMAVALEEAGLTNMFDHAMGCSTGALCACYFCAGESRKSVSGYYKEGVEDNYIRQTRPWKIFDLKIVDRIIRKEEPLDINRLRAFPGKIHVGLTDAQTGEGLFIDPRTFKDPLAPLTASCAIPFLDGKLSVELEGKRYVDGGVAWPLPVRYCVETLHCTDLLILMTHPFRRARESFIDKMGNIFVPFFYPRPFVQVFQNRLRRYNDGIDYLTASSHEAVRTCTLSPQHNLLSIFSENSKALKEAERASEEFMRDLLISRKD